MLGMDKMAKAYRKKSANKTEEPKKKLPPPAVSYGCTEEDYDMTDHIMVSPGVFRMKPEVLNKIRQDKISATIPDFITPSKETKMATKKKSPEKAAPKKKAAAKKETPAKAKKAVESTAEKKLPFSKAAIALIEKGKHTDAEIAEILKEEYPEKKHCDASAVKYNRRKHFEKTEEMLPEMVYTKAKNGKDKLINKEDLPPVDESVQDAPAKEKPAKKSKPAKEKAEEKPAKKKAAKKPATKKAAKKKK